MAAAVQAQVATALAVAELQVQYLAPVGPVVLLDALVALPAEDDKVVTLAMMRGLLLARAGDTEGAIAALNSSGYSGLVNAEELVEKRLQELRMAAIRLAQTMARYPVLESIIGTR